MVRLYAFTNWWRNDCFSLLDIFAKAAMDTPLVTWHEIKFVLLIIGIILFYVFLLNTLVLLLRDLLLLHR